jgi:hypothetical protein
MRDVMVQFDSNRMAEEYYNLLYNAKYVSSPEPKKVVVREDDMAH